MFKNWRSMELVALMGAMLAIATVLLLSAIFTEQAGATMTSMKSPAKPVCGQTLTEIDGTVSLTCRVFDSEWFTFTWGDTATHYRVGWTATADGRSVKGKFFTGNSGSYLSVNPRNRADVSGILRGASSWTLKVVARPLAPNPLFSMVIHLKGETPDHKVVMKS